MPTVRRRTQVAKGEVCKTFIQRFDSARRLRSACFVLVHLALLTAIVPVRSNGAAVIRTGVLVSVDPTGMQCSIRHTSGVIDYHVPTSAVLIHTRKPTDLTAFTVGLEVTVRVGRSSNGQPRLYDLTDSSSWRWLTRIRREITEGTITEIRSSEIVLKDRAEGGLYPYRITEKSGLERDGKPASMADYAVGDTVWIAPRMLPSGAAMATAVAGSKAAAGVLRERSQPTVTGTVEKWDLAGRSLTLKTRAGDRRILVVANDCVIRRDGKTVPAAVLKAGAYLTAHIKRFEEGVERVQRMTLKKPPARSPQR